MSIRYVNVRAQLFDGESRNMRAGKALRHLESLHVQLAETGAADSVARAPRHVAAVGDDAPGRVDGTLHEVRAWLERGLCPDGIGGCGHRRACLLNSRHCSPGCTEGFPLYLYEPL